MTIGKALLKLLPAIFVLQMIDLILKNKMPTTNYEGFAIWYCYAFIVFSVIDCIGVACGEDWKAWFWTSSLIVKILKFKLW